MDNGTIRKSIAAKIIAFVLFCCGAVGAVVYGMFVIGAADFGMINEKGYAEAQDYRDSYNVTYTMRQNALDTVDMNVMNDEFISGLPEDLMIRVWEADGDEKVLLYDDVDEDDIYRTESVLMHSEIYENSDGSDYWYTYIDGERIEDKEFGPNVHPSGTNTRKLVETRTYEAEISIRDNLIGDSFIGRARNWQLVIQKNLRMFVPGLIVSTIAFLAGFVMMIITAGWRKGADTPQPALLGRIPFDLLTVILAGLGTCTAAGIVAMADYFDINVVFNRSIMAGFLALMFIFAAVIWVWLYEMIARIRTKSLIRHNITSYIIIWMWKFCAVILHWIMEKSEAKRS